MIKMTATIYKITNLKTKAFYIGSTIEFKRRYREHMKMFRDNKHYNTWMQRSYNKHGLSMFVIEEIFNCSPEIALIVEQEFIDELKPKYNSAKSTLAPMLGKRHTKKAIQRIIETIPRGKRHYLYGKKMPESQRLKLVKARTGLKRTVKTKAKMSNTAKRINSIGRIDHEKAKKKVFDSNGNYFNSMVECAAFWVMSVQAVCDVLKGRTKKTKQGIRFYYENT